MAVSSKIEWTDASWNPVTGCTPISRGCDNCYARVMARRLYATGMPKYRREFEVALHRNELNLPLKWRKPRRIFVVSMGDLFHNNVPLSFIQQLFKTIIASPHHVFQVLTKRSNRLAEIAPKLTWPSNLWLGVTVESDEYTDRIRDLVKVPAAVKFVSFEPLLGPISKLDLSGIGWVIVGGESGPSSRPMQVEWVRPIRDYCMRTSIPFFFKQWGGRRRRADKRILDGKVWSEYPSSKLEGG